MIRALSLMLLLLPGMAFAHAGHLADLAGHDHWVAGAAIGLAVIVGVAGWLKDRETREDDAAEDEDAEEQAA